MGRWNPLRGPRKILKKHLPFCVFGLGLGLDSWEHEFYLKIFVGGFVGKLSCLVSVFYVLGRFL